MKPSPQLQKAELDKTRTALNDLVKRIARNRKIHWREVWHILYDRLRRRTGFDAVSKGIALHCIPLEAVQRSNKLRILFRLADELANNQM